MVKTVILCKNGTINSYLSALVIAMNKKKKGDDVSVIFIQGGLACLIDKKFSFSNELKAYSLDIEKNAAEMGIPSDPFELIKHAKTVGVPLYACQAWMKLLGGKPPRFPIPEGLQKLELTDLVGVLNEAKKVITI